MVHPLRPLAALVVLLTACVPKEPAPPDLRDMLDEVVRIAEDEGATVSAVVLDAVSGAPLYVHRDHARLLPASTMKVVSTAAALSALGAEFRFRTPVRLEGRLTGGLYRGDLVLEASGDPSLGSWRWEETAAACDTIAQALRARGVERWLGGVRVTSDEPIHDGPLGPGWAWDDVAYGFSAPPTRFAFHENVADLHVSRGAACGSVASARVEPPFAPLDTVVEGELVEHSPTLTCRRGSQMQTRCLWRVPAQGCPKAARVRLAVHEPQSLFAACLGPALERAGIAREQTAPKKAETAGEIIDETLLELVSPPLSELVRLTNKESLNLYAERIALRFASERRGSESFRAWREAIDEELLRRGLAPGDVLAADGSGLSRYNLANARGLARVLQTSLLEPTGEALVDSLPIAGSDGTLRGMTVSPVAEGRIRAKTGTLSGQRAYVGVVDRVGDAQRPRVVFAVMFGQLAAPSVAPAELFRRFTEPLVTAPIR